MLLAVKGKQSIKGGNNMFTGILVIFMLAVSITNLSIMRLLSIKDKEITQHEKRIKELESQIKQLTQFISIGK